MLLEGLLGPELTITKVTSLGRSIATGINLSILTCYLRFILASLPKQVLTPGTMRRCESIARRNESI